MPAARRATASRTASPTATAYFVYRFPFPSGTTSASATLTIDNEYVVEVERRRPGVDDGRDGRPSTIHDSRTRPTHTFDLTPHLGPDKAAYVRISDSFPEEGWGGRLYHLSASYAG